MKCPGNRHRVSRGAAAVAVFVLFCCSSGIAGRGEAGVPKAGLPARPTIPAAGRPSEPGPLNLLSAGRSAESLQQVLVPAADWHPYPRAAEREGWVALPESLRSAHIDRAAMLLGCDWETPKASVFLEFVRNGNRTNFENISFSRRARLAELVLGECAEGRGRFLDDIMNGIWTICEETYWGVPAHVGAQKRGPGLPDVTEPTVDLFAAETAMLLAWTDYLLGAELDRISPLIRERIRHEVRRRVLDPCLERDDFWWMGFGGRTVNNWNPWISSNWLTCVLLLEPDGARRVASVHKILRCLDNFLNAYPRDGGCDEGPGYWSRAGASLYDCLELLHGASAGKIDVFGAPLIKEIGRYIYRAHIAGPYFINFADAAAKAAPDPSVVFRYGRAIGDETLAGFGAFLAAQQNFGSDGVRGAFGWLGRALPALFHLEELRAAKPREPLLRDVWLPDLQVMGARSAEGSRRGFYVAAKGGHNAESHNHNDVGNFIVYHDGLPVLIDVGVETYTARTFSSRRYEIWTMQSAFHNLPTINGVMQRDGREYRASDLIYKSDRNSATLSLEIAGAYPDEAAAASWKRTVTLRRGKDVVIRERFALKEVKKAPELSLMSWRTPSLEAGGRIRLDLPEGAEAAASIAQEGADPRNAAPADSAFPDDDKRDADVKVGQGRENRGPAKGGIDPAAGTQYRKKMTPGSSRPLFILYDESTFRAAVEPIGLEDPQLRASWGNRIFRIILTAKKTPLKGEFLIRVTDKL